MDRLTAFSRTRAARRKGRNVSASVLTVTATLVVAGVAMAGVRIFARFEDDSGAGRSATADTTINAKNKFFDPGLGTNGQACVTCHQPFNGFTISPETIQDAFVATSGLDPLFRASDTADRPDADVSTPAARAVAYQTTLNLGVTRIGKTLPAGADFVVAPQDTAQFGPLPNPSDPQAPPGAMTLSLFRRPLVNTNVHFDSAVLWDGRASISDMPGQVKRAARTLLLSGGPTAGALGAVSDADAAEIVSFMLGVYTDQVKDENAGALDALGAIGGVDNLLALAFDPAAPCTPLAPPATCTPIVPDAPDTLTLFAAWADLPSNNAVNAARAAIARGEEVFNSANLTVPADLHIPGFTGNVAHCVTCHATNNIGNHPSTTFFVRLGIDSPDILSALADPRLDSALERLHMLPAYCLRPTSDPASFGTSPCGNDPGDVTTTDPGRALVTGKIADVGSFKPPILRDLGTRSPYFHNGMADSIELLIDFYDSRFHIGLTQQQHEDLAAFLESL